MIKLRFFSTFFYISFWAVAIEVYAVASSFAGQKILLISLLCAVFHEAGHLLMISHFCGKPQKIIISPFEVKICADLSKLSFIQDVLVTAFGVIANILLSLSAYILYLFIQWDFLLSMSVISLIIGALNILPVESFDGGQLLRLFLLRILSPKVTDIIALVISIIIIFPLIILGISVLFASQYNFSLFFIAIYIISFYIKRNCGDSVV